MKSRFRRIVSVCGMIIMLYTVFVNASAYSSWRYTGNINGYTYKYRSGIMNYSGEVQGRAHTEVSNNKRAPKGYMAARTFVYQKGGVLKASSGWAKNTKKEVGVDIAGAKYKAKTGAFYCIAKFKYKKDSTSYSGVYTGYETQCVGPLKASTKVGAEAMTNSLSNKEKRDILKLGETKDGLTYGSGMRELFGEQMPDLIEAIGDNNLEGYVKASDLDINGQDSKEMLNLEPGETEIHYIPLYSENGSVIGRFRIETTCVKDETL